MCLSVFFFSVYPHKCVYNRTNVFYLPFLLCFTANSNHKVWDISSAVLANDALNI